MSKEPGKRLLPQGRTVALIALAVALTLVYTAPGQAVDLSSGDYTLNLDTTISWGARYRVADRDMSLYRLRINLNADLGVVSDREAATNVAEDVADLLRREIGRCTAPPLQLHGLSIRPDQAGQQVDLFLHVVEVVVNALGFLGDHNGAPAV